MRHLVSKLLTGSLVAGAALMVAACGHSDTTNTTDNTTMTDMNTMEPEGTTNDMTAVDAAGNSDMMMGNGTDNSMDNGAMSNSGDMMTNNAM